MPFRAPLDPQTAFKDSSTTQPWHQHGIPAKGMRARGVAHSFRRSGMRPINIFLSLFFPHGGGQVDGAMALHCSRVAQGSFLR